MLNTGVPQSYLGHRKQRSHRNICYEKCVQGRKVKFPDSCFAKMSTEGYPQVSVLQQLSLSFWVFSLLTPRCLKESCLKAAAAASSVQSGQVSYHTLEAGIHSR